MLLRLVAARFRASRESASDADLKEFDKVIDQLEHAQVTPSELIARATWHVTHFTQSRLDLAVLAA